MTQLPEDEGAELPLLPDDDSGYFQFLIDQLTAAQTQLKEDQEALRTEQAQLKNDQAALDERQVEFEQWAIIQFNRQRSYSQWQKGFLKTLKEYQSVAVGLVGLAIALLGASPDVRADTAKTWVNGTSAAILGALCVAIQVKKTEGGSGSPSLEIDTPPTVSALPAR